MTETNHNQTLQGTGVMPGPADVGLVREVAEASVHLKELLVQLEKRIIGQPAVLRRLVMALLADGHVLLEGPPGLAKTTAVRALGEASDLKFSRVQFTPDLLPSDVVGTQVYDPTNHSFKVKRGPVFTNLLLADEINRAPAKVQSALLEAMQERQVTIGDDTFPLEQPFMVLATQNPIEQHGTYPLPEAQLDRFMFKVIVRHGSLEDEERVVNMMSSPSSSALSRCINAAQLHDMKLLLNRLRVVPELTRYIVQLVFATRPQPTGASGGAARFVEHGASPRASIALDRAARVNALIHGRTYVVPDDVRDVALDVLRHRIIPTIEAESEGLTGEAIARKVLDQVKSP